MVAKSRGARNQQVARAGEYFVVAELNKRGAFAVPFAGNMPRIDILACNLDQSRTVYIQVKTKQHWKTWQTNINQGRKISPRDNETNFWVFVDLGERDTSPRYWIVPEWWIRNDIYEVHQDYLNKHGGERARNPESTHHAIDEKRLEQWKDRWDILGIVELAGGLSVNDQMQ